MDPAQLCTLRMLREDTGVGDLSVDAAGTMTAIDARYSFSSSRVPLCALRKEYPDNETFLMELRTRAKKWNYDQQHQVLVIGRRPRRRHPRA